MKFFNMRGMMMGKKIKDFGLGVIYLIISPIYVPVMILWEEREQIKKFYSQCFQAITFKDIK